MKEESRIGLGLGLDFGPDHGASQGRKSLPNVQNAGVQDADA